MSKFVILHKRKTLRFQMLYNESAQTNISSFDIRFPARLLAGINVTFSFIYYLRNLTVCIFCLLVWIIVFLCYLPNSECTNLSFGMDLIGSNTILTYLLPGTDNFAADGRVYLKINEGHIELYTDFKDLSAEQKVETVLDSHGIFFDRLETWVESEKMYEVLYPLHFLLRKCNLKYLLSHTVSTLPDNMLCLPPYSFRKSTFLTLRKLDH